MKDKLKKIIGTIVFLAIFGVLLTATDYTLRPQGNGNYRYVLPGLYAQEENSLDLAFIGSSSVFRFYDNPYMYARSGITSYNVSMGAEPMAAAPYLIEEVKKRQDPQLFIVETRTLLTQSEENERAEIFFRRVTDNMNFSLNRLKLIRSYVSRPTEFLEYAFDLICYHDNWQTMKLDDLKYADNRADVPMMGWKNIFKVLPLKAQKSYPNQEPVALKEDGEAALIGLLEYCKKNDIPLLVIESPFPMSKTRVGRNLTIKSMVESYGYEFLNLNDYTEEIGLDFSVDYYDSRHVNSWGARKVTDHLLSYLQDQYGIQAGQHSQAAAAKWEEAAAMDEEQFQKYADKYPGKAKGE